jgi:[protein-PII] uridylyltransferase
MNTSATALPAALFDPAAFSKQLDDDSSIACCKPAISNANQYLDDLFQQGTEVGQLIALRAIFMDALLGALWDRQDWRGAPLALVAVGGYGRGELHPHSDIDLLILQGDSAQDGSEQLGKFLTLLWDIGLNIGHSVRTVEQCSEAAKDDITIVTNLMEARVIRGKSSLMEAVRQATNTEKMWPSAEFFSAKLKEQQSRHAKFADTEYNLEPNVKSSPGGLRDLQIIGWIAERHFGVESLEDLSIDKFLNPDEMEILIRGREFMWGVRYALHMITGREEDRLLFDHQRELATLWGFEDGDKLAVEQFMQTYYRWALALTELNDMLMQLFNEIILKACDAEKIFELNARFRLRNNYIEVTNDNVFKTTPSALLEIFVIMSQQPRGNIKGVRHRIAFNDRRQKVLHWHADSHSRRHATSIRRLAR